MSDKIIWSTNATQDYALGLSREEKINLLLDRGYDEEMIIDASDEELNDVIENDDYMWQDDSEDFEYNIAPMIAKQSKDGIVIMFGKGARWDGTRQLGRAVDATELKGGDIDPDVTDIKIVDDGEGLVWEGAHHDGTHVMNLYAIPEDEGDLLEFVSNCMFDLVQDRLDYEGFDEVEDAVEDVAINLSTEDINEWCDFEQVPDFCQRIKDLNMTESLDESTEITEVKAKDPQGLRAEYNEIRDLADEYGKEYFTSMPFTAYDNDPESIEFKYPNFFKVVKAFFKEMGILEADELNDSDALDLEWDSDINDHDWETLMKACDLITTKNKKKGTYDPYQFEKIYKDNYSDGLDDAKILADRERAERELAGDFDEDLDKDVEVEFECADCGHTYKKQFNKDYFEDESDLENTMDQAEDDCPECGGHARAVAKEDLGEGVEKGEDELELAMEDPGIKPNFELDDEDLNEAVDEVSVELDVVSDEKTPENVVSEIRFFVPNENIKIEVVDMDGPGGGWPLVRFTGNKDDLLRDLPELGYDEDDLLDFIDEDNLDESIDEEKEDEFGKDAGPWGKF